MGNAKWIVGTCEVCGRKRLKVTRNHGVMACRACTVTQSRVSKCPEILVTELKRQHGDKYFPAVKQEVPVVPVDELQTVKVLAEIREALGIGDDWALADLPEIVAEKMADLAAANEQAMEHIFKIKELTMDMEAQADIIKAQSSPDPALLPDDITETGVDIVIKCDMLKEMLLEKNRSYGDSAMNPVRVFSRADPGEQLLVRIDDKLSRLAKGKEFAGDDTVMDLIGDLVLLLVHRGLAGLEMREAA